MRCRLGRFLVVLFGVSMIFAATGAGAIPVTISSTFVSTPPTIDGTAGATEWAGPVSYVFGHGDVLFRNDASNLYVLFDVTADTTQDASSPIDYFWLAFDVNHNGIEDPNVDVEYGLCNTVSDFTRTLFLGSCSTTGCGSTTGSLAHGFGSTPASATPHTFWEIAIPLSELGGASLGSNLGVQMRSASTNPAFVEDTPTSECDFPGYATLQLGGSVVTIPTLDRTGLLLLGLFLVAGAGLLLRGRWG